MKILETFHKRVHFLSVLALAVLLCGCGLTARQDGAKAPVVAHGQSNIGQEAEEGASIPPLFDDAIAQKKVAGFYDKKPTQCVPYAREVSGLRIFGDAHTWWRQAANMGLERGTQPHEGSVLVLKKGKKLSLGHVAVVKRVLSNREMDVTHSNWGNNTKKRSFIYESMRVRDVSPNNDWSQLRFWNKYSNAYGSIYPNHGFIYPTTQMASAQ